MISKLKELMNKITKAGLLHFVRNDNTRKKMAFTLAEVLITLGIIGVVAALTLPTLNNKINDVIIRTRLKNTYALISQAMRYAQHEFGDLETWGFTGDWTSSKDMEIFADHVNRYLKIATDCGFTNEKGCVVDAPNYGIDGTPNTVNYATCTSPYYYKVTLLNGASLLYRTGEIPGYMDPRYVDIYTYTKAPNNMQVFVDVNGKKGPNTWGRDLFAFIYSTKDKIFIPYGDPRLGGYQKCLNKTHGTSCTYYVMYVGKTTDY